MGDGNFASRISCKWPEKQSSSRSQSVNPTTQMSKGEEKHAMKPNICEKMSFNNQNTSGKKEGGSGLMTSVQNKVIKKITLDVKFVNIYK
jgi:hypothetical protein